MKILTDYHQKSVSLTVEKDRQVLANEILLFKADINYTNIQLVSGEVFVLAETLKRFEDKFFSHQFIRVNRSIVLNISQIKKVNFDYVLLKNNQKIDISRRRKKVVEAHLSNKKIISPK